MTMASASSSSATLRIVLGMQPGKLAFTLPLARTPHLPRQETVRFTSPAASSGESNATPLGCRSRTWRTMASSATSPSSALTAATSPGTASS